ncbi:myoD family inhibitor domain-containing protein 2 [Lampris incognitus]|uniref:myoD family inhibitor domain-containing protein 2 n=1 Tax=Lampris incognitus TaxID=2546036 RepID=UPI0024B5DFF2|nr:myoD family inhibitor domain-containing protein 2 [Lampris incognitus]
MTQAVEEKGKEGASVVEEKCTGVRDEGVQSGARIIEMRFNGVPESELAQTSAETHSQQPRQHDGSTAPLFTVKKCIRRSSSSSTSSSSSFSMEVDCAGIILNCLFCRIYNMFLMLPDSCQTVAYHCCPTYTQVSTTVDSVSSSDHSSNMDLDCGLLRSCHDTSECLELAMEISEICYR